MPEIITTGLLSPAIKIEQLAGESHESIRANAGNLTVAAGIYIYLLESNGDENNGDLAMECLQTLGISEIDACRIVGGASASIKGLGVRFHTRFLESDRIGGPRVYEKFESINRVSFR